MNTKLICRYDPIGDILYIDQCSPYADQESEEMDDEIIARLNPKTGVIENLAILFFSKWLRSQTLLELPIIAQLQLAS